ncbi:hypothetical protein [Cohaesibacter gelatinilyticus]|uniref:hypothetical protein n=1 Tax=Cohaesibacter gelatinilyticus TaxID=372072 RepID=UPI000BE258F2|nr:hypothetical protein [Cohaesibacter gelatinilyticus]
MKSFDEEIKLLDGKFNCRIREHKFVRECTGGAIVQWWVLKASNDDVVKGVELQWKRDTATQSVLDYTETRGLPENEFKSLRLAIATEDEFKLVSEKSLIWYKKDRSSIYHSQIKIRPFL